jgi:hypothetical protein
MRNERLKLLIWLMFFMAIGWRTRVSAGSHLCPDVCSDSTLCATSCYATEIDFENGNPTTCLGYGLYDESQYCCGDGFCLNNSDEPAFCPSDCGTCNGTMGSDCDFATQTGCSAGHMCNPCDVCKPIPYCSGSSCNGGKNPVPPDCFQDYCSAPNYQCCPGSKCFGADTGEGVCVPSDGPS